MEEVAEVEMEYNSSTASFSWVSVEATRASVHVVGCAATTKIHLLQFLLCSKHPSVSQSVSTSSVLGAMEQSVAVCRGMFVPELSAPSRVLTLA